MLRKIFGVTRAQRTLQRSDFHLPKDVAPDDRTTRELFIDVVLALPELKKGSGDPETVAPTFRHQQIEGPKKTPMCRMRLEGRWQDDGTAEGEVTQELFWVDHLKEKVEADDSILSQLRTAGSFSCITPPLPVTPPRKFVSRPARARCASP